MSLTEAISPVIAEVLRQNEETSTSLRGGAFCASFERKLDGEPWVQVKNGVLNIFYPSDEPPLPRLLLAVTSLPRESKCRAWEPWKYATLEFGPISSEKLTMLVRDLFVHFYELPEDTELVSEVLDMRENV